ncbi:hypothetical protein DFH06DRAFT_1145555 [Mycena polygramma]|nr:hypothetical protein DFH06DRAFT_1145555 [Mycena polygramma]
MPNQDIHPSRFNGVLPNTEANLIRRRSNFPKDRYLDFDKPMLGLVWIKDGEPAAQVTLYPREDMRVRLSDHKVALAAAGFEQGTGAIAVYMEGIGEARGWHACTWDTPVRVRKTGDTILITYERIKDWKDIDTLSNFCF